MRVAMWSGPRNLSTAMMYAFAARGDFAVWDEPFYAAYLEATGLDHPMRAEVLGAHERDPEAVARRCAGPVPGGKPHAYMKHMAFHILDGFPMGWVEVCTHVHLIRHPARVVASYAAKREHPTLADIGFEAQAEIFAKCPGPVIDSADIRANPDRALRALCAEIGLAFDPRMLSWPAGGHPDDGVWAAHWYGAVHRSTGFAGAEGALPELGGDYAALVRAAMPFYEEMSARALALTA